MLYSIIFQAFQVMGDLLPAMFTGAIITVIGNDTTDLGIMNAFVSIGCYISPYHCKHPFDTVLTIIIEGNHPTNCENAHLYCDFLFVANLRNTH